MVSEYVTLVVQKAIARSLVTFNDERFFGESLVNVGQ